MLEFTIQYNNPPSPPIFKMISVHISSCLFSESRNETINAFLLEQFTRNNNGFF